MIKMTEDPIKKMYEELGILDSFRQREEDIENPIGPDRKDLPYLIDMLKNHSKVEKVDTNELITLLNEIDASYQKVTYKKENIEIPKTPEQYIGIRTEFEFKDEEKAHLFPHLRFRFSMGVLKENTTLEGFSGHYTSKTTLNTIMGDGILIVPENYYNEILNLANDAKLKY
ncbi:hypothetical protein GQ473_05825 [archaeon]|nr:hypothetical protein [archaeon]